MGWFSRKVAVIFIDDATGTVFASTELSPEALPETFEIDTRLDLGDSQWVVVSAMPTTRDAYAKSKRLSLRLRRIEQRDPREILFSLPSLCDSIPSLSDVPVSGDELVLTEDDWRQVEFVSSAFDDHIAAELDAIRRIHEHASSGVGWREIHVRRHPESPIAVAISPDDIARALGFDAVPAGIAYPGASTRIAGGFAFAVADGRMVYGLAYGERTTVIGLAQRRTADAGDDTVAALRALAARYDLRLIDWCRCGVASPDDADFARLV